MPDDNSRPEPTFYQILGLAGRLSSEVVQHDVKAAYHRSLLRYHPDKINASVTAEGYLTRHEKELYTVDQITEAYNTLASPVTRAAYDKKLEMLGAESNGKLNETLHSGVEIHDLEDLVYNEDNNVWVRGCRCGDPHGYVLTEVELDRESREGEIYVACKGCSLWIKVLFGTTETDREEEEGETEQHQQSSVKVSV